MSFRWKAATPIGIDATTILIFKHQTHYVDTFQTACKLRITINWTIKKGVFLNIFKFTKYQCKSEIFI